jgi:hypothetical protein
MEGVFRWLAVEIVEEVIITFVGFIFTQAAVGLYPDLLCGIFTE